MLKQSLSQKLQQRLSPQQIQLMKLLQIPTATLEQRIKEELEANPALEEGGGEDADELYESNSDELYDDTHFGDDKDEDGGGDDDFNFDDDFEERNNLDDPFEMEEYLDNYIEDDTAAYKLSANNHSPDEEDKSVPIAGDISFHEYLIEQLGLLRLDSQADEYIARQIIGSIDEDGYLRREVRAIVDDLMFTQNVNCRVADVERVLRQVQSFDPPGVGARDLQECLLLQLRRKAQSDEVAHADKLALRLAIRLVDEYFEEFTKKHFDRMARYLSVREDQLRDALEEIIRLNPKPASGYSGDKRSAEANYIVPDFLISNRDGELELTLNQRNMPELRVSDHYKEMLRSYSPRYGNLKPSRQQREAVMFIKQKIDSARWFIDAIRQRQDTMSKTMSTIMYLQEAYFLTGDERKLRPMILKDVADITGLDISTVSRVANSKYVQTEFGTKRLKEFFSESLSTDSGDEVSTYEVKKILSEIIERENKRKPYSDEHLKDMLNKQGYNIARRTVAKYREQLNIPVARLRKEL